MSLIMGGLRSHRMKSGFSQRELAELIGLFNGTQVGRHERSEALPTLLAAMSYEALFQIQIAELFPELHETIVQRIDHQLITLESKLHDSTVRDRTAYITARKLEWLNGRNNPVITDSLE
jgi:DNA-binding XRE family transcriptional regulator